jgi:hypothetical protein
MPEYDDGDEDFNDPDITDDVLARLSHERQVLDLDLVSQTKKLLQEAGPAAALNLITMANSAQNENVKYNANKFIVEKLLDPANEGSKGVLEDLIGDLVVGAERIANGGQI